MITGTSGWRTSRSPTSPPPPWTTLTTPAGTPASTSSSTKRSPSSGVSVGGLEDDRVPADERGRDLPRGDRDREVPRRDHADHADRLRTLMLNLSRSSRRRRLAEEPPALAAHVEAHVDRFLDVAARPRRAPSPSRGSSARRARPCGRRAAGRSGRGSRRGAAPARAANPRTPPWRPRRRGRRPRRRAREDAEHVAVRGARRLEGLPGGGVDPLAADEVLEGLGRRSHGGDSSPREEPARSAQVSTWCGSRSRRARRSRAEACCPPPRSRNG